MFGLQPVSATPVARCQSCAIRSEVSVRVVQGSPDAAVVTARQDSGVSHTVDPVNATGCLKTVTNGAESV